MSVRLSAPKWAYPIYLVFVSAVAVMLPEPPPARAAAVTDELFDSWDKLLQQYVRPSGGVDYKALQTGMPDLQAFVDRHRDLELGAAGESTRKAVYINLYNATMMLNLLRHASAEKLDTSSTAFLKLEINDIKVKGGNIWNGDLKVVLAGHSLNLDQIEHGLIRAADSGVPKELQLKSLDARIHAAVNCAAVSCPRVRERAYRPSTIEAMLDENMREFTGSDAQFSKTDEDTMNANSIVFWYYDDFEQAGRKLGSGKGAGDYLAGFMPEGTKDREWKIKHLKENFNDRGKVSLKLSSAFSFSYDWRVNDIRNKP